MMYGYMDVYIMGMVYVHTWLLLVSWGFLSSILRGGCS